MRKLILLTIIVLFTLSIKAQSWCTSGAQWHYRLYNPIPFHYADGYIQLNNTGTVSVGGKVCDNLIGSRYGVFLFSGLPSTTVTNYTNVQTYINNNVVYVYNLETLVFDTLANFNAGIGDKWRLINYPGSISTSSCSFSRPICTVTNTSTVLINSQILKTLQITFQMYSNTYTTSIIEKIGSVNGFLFPYYHCIVDGPSYGSFICYSDNNFTLYNPSGIACNYTTVGLNEIKIKDEELKIYPNPANDVLNVEINLSTSSGSSSVAKLEIINSLGQVVYQSAITNQHSSINIKQLSNGFYQLKLSEGESQKLIKFIKSN